MLSNSQHDFETTQHHTYAWCMTYEHASAVLCDACCISLLCYATRFPITINGARNTMYTENTCRHTSKHMLSNLSTNAYCARACQQHACQQHCKSGVRHLVYAIRHTEAGTITITDTSPYHVRACMRTCFRMRYTDTLIHKSTQIRIHACMTTCTHAYLCTWIHAHMYRYTLQAYSRPARAPRRP